MSSNFSGFACTRILAHVDESSSNKLLNKHSLIAAKIFPSLEDLVASWWTTRAEKPAKIF
jgi:hypothetical protein